MTRTRLSALLLAAILCIDLPVDAQSLPTQEAERWRDIAARIQPATLVKVRLKDGSQVKGIVLGVDQASLTLKPKTRIPVPTRDIAFNDVESIQRAKEAMNPGAKVVLGAASVVGGLLIMAAIALAVYD